MDFREIQKQNRTKTKIVIAVYLVIYAFIGLLLDVVFQGASIANNINLNLIDVMVRLINLETIPYASISMFVIGIITVLISIKMFKKIQLSGERSILIDENNKEYKDLYNIMQELKIAGNMMYVPDIYLIKADYMNAFASGWSEDNTIVAITEGLYEKLTRDELMAVMAHELSHIRNEDIKLTLIIGVATNIMLFVINIMVNVFFRSNSKAANQAKFVLLILNFVLPLITMMLNMWMSRSREYMADAGAVELIRDPNALSNALKKISGDYEENNYIMPSNNTRKAAYIYEPKDNLFSTHPSIENRISKLSRNR